MIDQNLTLLTDFYELTMMQGYFLEKRDDTVVFDMFYRTNPFGGGYAIACGLAQVIDYIRSLRFGPDEIAYLRTLNIFDEGFLEYLSGFKFSGDIYAVPEGTIVFPMEPMLKVVAPIMEAQLLETAILTIINHQSLIATKASRVCYSAKGDPVMEFGLRRAQGPDAGVYGARAAVIGGCIGTSNVLAAKLFGMPALGTHAHSWIMSFEDELTAFRSYARIYPQNTTLLADTYDTLRSGVPHAIQVFDECKQAGQMPAKYGIRLDSGDLSYLSKAARDMLDEAGYPDAQICASSDLDEYLIDALKDQGAKIDTWGVGTNMITSKDCPSFGGVYKLAAMKHGETYDPKIKLSDNAAKITNPGNKQFYRVYLKEEAVSHKKYGLMDKFKHEVVGAEPPNANFDAKNFAIKGLKIKADLISLENESFSENEDLHLFDPVSTWKRTVLPAGSFVLRKMLIPVFINGKCIYESPSVMELRNICTIEQNSLWDESRRLVNPHEVYVDLSDELYRTKRGILEGIYQVES